MRPYWCGCILFIAILIKCSTCYGIVKGYGETCQSDEVDVAKNQSAQAPFVTILNSTELILALTGQSRRLLCCMGGSPRPSITWLKDDSLLDIKENYKLEVFEQGQILQNSNVLKSDAGNYTCIGSNPLGNASHSFYFTVQERQWDFNPIIQMHADQWNATIFSNITLTCQITSSKKPFVSWIHIKNFTTPSFPRVRHILTNNGGDKWTTSLPIVNVSYEDGGKYICRSTNAIGHKNVSQDEGVLYVMDEDNTMAGRMGSTSQTRSDKSLVIGLSLGVLLFIVLLVLSALVLRRRQQHHGVDFKTLLFADPKRFIDQTELLAPEETHHEFDVFISYSSQDRDLVKNVFYPEITRTHKVCIDFKDFEAGLYITDNIANAIFKSRKTLLMITRNFLRREGGWTYFEMQIAQGRLQHGHDVLVPVMLENIPLNELPSTLQHYRSRRTWLEWFNEDVRPHFWERLRVALEPSLFEHQGEGAV
ncbi:fibroblast growth factor receptor 3 [Nematostella vectensis]|uniref:fibroblast growth factor receptor 3 n=1 Tax=Nematostella vectensis TaxID=45351 RepID=UPI00138FFF7C|nr:fibroblast growth factor receptor 3 [Nematostella vectensis]